MTPQALGLGSALATGWQALMRRPALGFGGIALYYLITMAIGYVPCLGSVAQILLTPPLQGGVTIFSLNLVDDRTPSLEDLFAGFRAYGKWMGIYWLLAFVSFIALLPCFILASVAVYGTVSSGHRLPEQAAVPVLGAAALLAVAAGAAGIAVLIRWAFVYFAGVESEGTIQAFTKSAEITKGRRLELFWMLFVLTLLSFSGVLALGVGLFVTLPLAQCATAALYRQLQPAPPRAAAGEGAPPAQWPGAG